MMRVLMLEPHIAGHRSVYVEYLLAAMERHGDFEVTWPVSSVDRNTLCVRDLTSRFGGMLRVVELDIRQISNPFFGSINARAERQFRYTTAFRNIVAVHGPRSFDFVFIPFVDEYGLAPLATMRKPFFGLPWGGIVVHPSFHMSLSGYAPRRFTHLIERALYALLLRQKTDLHELFTIDPYFSAFINDARVRYVPDPAMLPSKTQSGALSELEGISTDPAILVYGLIDNRKGIPVLLDALADTRMPGSVKLVLVGRQSKDIEELLRRPFSQTLRGQGRLIEVNRIVSDLEESTAFQRAKIVWNFYPGIYGPSGVLVRAGQARKPVICIREGYCGRVVTEKGMGIAIKEGDPEALVLGLLRLLGDGKLCDQMGQAGFDNFSTSSPKVFADPIISSISEGIRAT